MNTKPATVSVTGQRFVSRQVIVAVIGLVMVVAAVVAGAMLGQATSPMSPAGAVVVTESPSPVLLGGGVSGSGGTTGGSQGGLLSGSAVGSVGGAGGVTSR